MNILVVGCGFPNEKFPGRGIFEFDQAKALAEYGHKVVYVAVDLRSVRRWRKWGCLSFTSSDIEVYSCSIPVGAIGDGIKDYVGKKCFAALYKKIEKRYGKPDVIHAHFGDMAVYVSEVCERNEIPFVITEHSSAINKPEVSPNLIRRYREAYRKANAVLAVGLALAKNIKKYTGVSAVVVPNMVDIEPFALCTQMRKEGEPFRFLSAGYLIQRKGFDLLLKAFALFCEKHKDAVLQIMGGGPEQSSLQKLARDLGVADHVVMTGAYVRGEFGEALQMADCFVLATRGETFGVVYIEAMAAGVPVIATRCGGPEDFVTRENGEVVPVEDIEALAGAMENMYRNIGLYDGTVIRENVLRKFSPQTIAERLTAVYHKVTN